MLVVVADNLPPAVRGRMKLWFVEVKPNVFVSGLRDSVATKVVDYLFQHCTDQSGLMIFKSINRPPGYEVRTLGETKKSLITISGLSLVVEKQNN
ncbi:type I-E CRISPR-associated endoribonuclease Cas2 [Vibrio vulnificus]|uniref:type I-E CRISPR-associated endoribonuclease Cas2e n=1 Tax=Vibrio vulnificus TaxID=672 RepID=UPI00102CEA09|nr:type I-E CRISPR-associated endoribonuclease Cas2e [Vibrio vulnificus]EIA0806491.1 type I-E CRISPR-associated endoribonuclease Cas2 [Vibrio vulnificus]EJN6713288.1 type I-E CRISPR-associated endoribonuclease Cas2 [Vibrio vulnificus]MCU8269058.1 type I-E CRISPR-associated endoribonuclease Cas2e [Vibrio vulnificus]RZR41764.1 type I-E CRISPR-associated endoribonuclease Cas2 [Vibrio vulnificus]